ncbi:MAG: hypothetical protein ABSH19_04240, partial [Opitutales bacterium]
MKASTAPGRWRVMAREIALLAAAFAFGWIFSVWIARRAATAGPGADGQSSSVKSAAQSASDFSQAKALLSHALKMTGLRNERSYLNLITSLDAATVQALLSDLIAHPKSDDSGAMYDLIVRWAELDPKAALAWTQNLHDLDNRRNGMAQVLKTWSGQNPADALAALRALPSGLQVDPPTWIGQKGFSHTLYTDLFSTWAASDPAAAAAGALNLPPSASRNASLAAVADAWAQQDPAAALAWAQSLPDGAAHDGAFSAAVLAMSELDPQAAAALAATLGNVDSRDDLLRQIARDWAVEDPTAALAWAQNSLTGSAQTSALQAAFMDLSYEDPASAAAYLTQLPPSLSNSFPETFILANSWASTDSQAALNWALSLPDTGGNIADAWGNMRQLTLSVVLFSWSNSDPVAAAAYVSNLTSDPDFAKLATTVAREWGNDDPQATLAWAQSLPAGDAQNTVIASAVGSLARLDPQAALTDAQQLTGASRDQAVGSVISIWAAQQPSQA